MPKRTDIHKILLIGSGPIVIGQACEFDYSGSQAARALRAEGYKVVLVNSNPATIMIDPIMADVINDLVVECVRDLGATGLSITHDMASARKIADRIAMLYEGRLIWNGPVAEIDTSGNPYVDQFIHGRAEGPIQMQVRRD